MFNELNPHACNVTVKVSLCVCVSPLVSSADDEAG